MRILTLFVRHGTEKYSDALDELRKFQRSRLPSARHDLLVIDNGPGGLPLVGSSNGDVIRGSNAYWEFSAWDDGLRHVGSRTRDYDFVHLVTSAFRTLYTRYIDRFHIGMLDRVAGRGIALGHIDYYNEPVELLRYPTQAWIRSSFVFIPPAELATLGCLVGLADTSRFFSGDPAHPFRPDAPLSENYKRYIFDWLTGQGTGQGVTWHSRFTLSTETLPFFQAKAMAMLNEQLLAIRLRKQGCALVDATWLATLTPQSAAFEVLESIPHWRIQLAQRDTDAVPVPPSPT